MLFLFRKFAIRKVYKQFSTSTRTDFKTVILGGATEVGQYLGLLLKKNPRVTCLAIYDVAKPTPGIGLDLSHISTFAPVCSYVDDAGLECALKGSSLVIITAGKRFIDLKKGKENHGSKILETNAKILAPLAAGIAKHCPCAFVAITTEPINSTVPLVSEIIRKKGKHFNPCKIFGVTKLDLCRASTFVAAITKADPFTQFVPVIGGHSGSSIIPLLSQSKPKASLKDEESIRRITKKIQYATNRVISGKAGLGSATLCMAYATALFSNSLLKAMSAEELIIEYAYVRSPVSEVPYFSSPVLIGPYGIEQFLTLGELSKYEHQLLDKAYKRNFKVTILGGAGGIGQPLAMLLKMNPRVTELGIYDVSKITRGVIEDLSHMNFRAEVNGGVGIKQLCPALSGSSLIVIPAGLPRKKGMKRQDLFNANSSVMFGLLRAIAVYSPTAIITIIMNPVNALVPLVSEFMRRSCLYDPRRIFGITTLDIVRASTLVGREFCIAPECLFVPVVGGHAGDTIIPLFSKASPELYCVDIEKRKTLTKKIQDAGADVIKAKGSGSATLSMAYAAERLINSILCGLLGQYNVEYAYVASKVTCEYKDLGPEMQQIGYFAGPVLLGPCGIEKVLDIGEIDDYEKELFKKAAPQLLQDIKAGVEYINARAKMVPVQISKCY